MTGDYKGEYDNILYYYAYNFAIIQNEYVAGCKRDKKFRYIDTYIKDWVLEKEKEQSEIS